MGINSDEIGRRENEISKFVQNYQNLRDVFGAFYKNLTEIIRSGQKQHLAIYAKPYQFENDFISLQTFDKNNITLKFSIHTEKIHRIDSTYEEGPLGCFKFNNREFKEYCFNSSGEFFKKVDVGDSRYSPCYHIAESDEKKKDLFFSEFLCTISEMYIQYFLTDRMSLTRNRT